MDSAAFSNGMCMDLEIPSCKLLLLNAYHCFIISLFIDTVGYLTDRVVSYAHKTSPEKNSQHLTCRIKLSQNMQAIKHQGMN
jgi:hypothetical protein